MTGGAPPDSQFSGRASNSPSLSVPMISSTDISGKSPSLVKPLLARPAIAPSVSSSFSSFLSRMRSEPFSPVNRARSRLVAPGFSVSRASRRALSSLGACAGLRANYSPATGSGFFLAAAFLPGTAFAAGFFSAFSRFLSLGLRRRLLLFLPCRFRPWRRVPRSGFVPVPARDGQGIEAFRNGGVGFAIAGIRAITALQHFDRHAVCARAKLLQQSNPRRPPLAFFSRQAG